MTRRSILPFSRSPLALVALALATLGWMLPASPVRALEAGAGEAKILDACDKRLCDMVQLRNPAGEDLKCLLTKTWARSTIKEGDQSTVKWMFGDARCTVQLDISRQAIVSALSGGLSKFRVPPHTASCVVEEDGQLKNVRATVSPKIWFRDGRAEKIWINLLNVEGPASIKATLSTAAQLNDSIGIFHRAMLKSVNGYIYKHCPKYHPTTQSAAASPAKPAAAKPPKPADPAPAVTAKKQGG
jgi:hypothetical protein